MFCCGPVRGRAQPSAMLAWAAVAALLWASPASGFKVIGAGFPKTGLRSLEHALQILGYKVYRFGHIEPDMPNATFGHREDLQRWMSIVGNATDGTEPLEQLDQLMDSLVGRGFDAILDVPMDVTDVALRVIKRFRDAKVVLTEHHDSDTWFDHYQVHMQDFEISTRRFSPNPHVTMGKTLHSLRKLMDQICLQREVPLVPKDRDRGLMISLYDRHNAEIKAGVEENRLLLFKVETGWKPLCEFLGKEEPEQKFPKLNQFKYDMQHLRAQQEYNRNFNFMMCLIFLWCGGSMAYGGYQRWSRAAKVMEEKANV